MSPQIGSVPAQQATPSLFKRITSWGRTGKVTSPVHANCLRTEPRQHQELQDELIMVSTMRYGLLRM